MSEGQPIRDWEGEYNALQYALIGDTGLSGILEASKHLRMRKALERIAHWATMARHDMQGRLEDEAHRKAFLTLSAILGECESVR